MLHLASTSQTKLTLSFLRKRNEKGHPSGTHPPHSVSLSPRSEQQTMATAGGPATGKAWTMDRVMLRLGFRGVRSIVPSRARVAAESGGGLSSS